MKWLIDFWVEGSLILSLGLLFYKLVLEKLTFFDWNRVFLLSIMGMALVIPFLSFQLSESQPVLQEFLLPTFEFGQGIAESQTFNWFELLLWVYIIGVGISLIRTGLGLVKLIFQLQLVEKFKYQGLVLAVHPKFEPASFFGIILLPSFNPEDPDHHQILLHESVHVKKKHSWDLLFTHLFKSLFWFNPLVILFEKLLREVHEFQADHGVIGSYSQFDYSRLLLRLIVQDRGWQLAHSFNQFQTKKRILMMNREKSNSVAKSRFLMIVPLVAMMVLVFACDQNISDENAIKPENTVEIINENGDTELHGMVNGKLVEIGADEIFDVVEDMPTPTGGMSAWGEYLMANLKYPDKAKQMGIEGTVVLAFVVNTDGSISDVEILRGIGAGCDEEAHRVVQNAPNWEPGKQRGQAVRTRMRLPIRFKLS
ncbi:M56 family peptidase [Algoriphagus kandeliae]|uniref:M56 family peptidase n=1 Tax=Algoriphagus kandeliae TaxID=2562278 RepID=A0A4Y9R2A3_9BACT|nr:M56 family peptidase [Algoriphagus kandeliae]